MDTDTSHPQITAHRAGAKLGPENSLTALRRSIASSIDCAEVDAQLTADGAVVIVHDADLLRLSHREDLSISQCTLADLLRVELAGRERIATLEEFIAAARGRIRLNIELKDYGHSDALAERVVAVLRSKGFLGEAMISSSSRELLGQVRRHEPRLQLGLVLCSESVPDDFPFEFLSAEHRFITASLVRKIHRRRSQIHAWTVNDRETMLRLLALGVDNIITDDPLGAKETLSHFRRIGPVGRWFLRRRNARA